MLSRVGSTQLWDCAAAGDQEEVGGALAPSIGLRQVEGDEVKPNLEGRTNLPWSFVNHVWKKHSYLAYLIIEPVDHEVADPVG